MSVNCLPLFTSLSQPLRAPSRGLSAGCGRPRYTSGTSRFACSGRTDGGGYIVYELLTDDDRRKNVLGLMSSLNMLIETRGGFDYTGADCQGWMREIGFKETRIEHLGGADYMIVGIK